MTHLGSVTTQKIKGLTLTAAEA